MIETDSKITIIHTVSSLRKSSGITDAVAQSAMAGINGGYETLIITWANKYSVDYDHVDPRIKVIKLGWNNNPLLRFFIFAWQLRNILKIFQAQKKKVMVHDHGLWMDSNIASCLISFLCSAPFIISPHGSLEDWAIAQKRIKKRIALLLYQKLCLKKAAFIHATSDSEKVSVLRFVPTAAVEVIGLGADLVKEKDVSKCNSKTAIFLSRIHKKKGIDLLIEAWARAVHDGWKLIIVGPDEDTYFDNVKDLIRERDLEEEITLAGALYNYDKQQALSNSSLFILPTYSENFGLVVPEALISGLPVITTNKTPWLGLQEIGCGWTISPDVDELILALEEATAMSPLKLKLMGDIGRSWVVENFTWGSFGKKMISLYTKV